jgi:hypothetical protein
MARKRRSHRSLARGGQRPLAQGQGAAASKKSRRRNAGCGRSARGGSDGRVARAAEAHHPRDRHQQVRGRAEKDRVGIGTFQPKDEKNQDSTELTGDINYRKIAEYGSDSDPRAFNFDGEFNIANRGVIEFIEVLKLDVAFLYDLLGASQEHRSSRRSSPRPTSTR